MVVWSRLRLKQGLAESQDKTFGSVSDRLGLFVHLAAKKNRVWISFTRMGLPTSAPPPRRTCSRWRPRSRASRSRKVGIYAGGDFTATPIQP